MLVSADLRLTLINFQIHDRRVSLFLDGLEEDGTPFDTQPLTARLSDFNEDGAMWVGLSSNGTYDWFLNVFLYFELWQVTLFKICVRLRFPRCFDYSVVMQ